MISHGHARGSAGLLSGNGGTRAKVPYAFLGFFRLKPAAPEKQEDNRGKRMAHLD